MDDEYHEPSQSGYQVSGSNPGRAEYDAGTSHSPVTVKAQSNAMYDTIPLSHTNL
jgi:hypothetical protein